MAPFTGIRQTGHAEDEGTQQGGDAEHQNDAAEDEEMVSERQEQNGTGGDEGVEENVDDGFHLHLSDVGNIKVIFFWNEFKSIIRKCHKGCSIGRNEGCSQFIKFA